MTRTKEEMKEKLMETSFITRVGDAGPAIVAETANASSGQTYGNPVREGWVVVYSIRYEKAGTPWRHDVFMPYELVRDSDE